MLEEAAGSTAAISQLPNPLALQTKTFGSGYRPALFLPQLTAGLFCPRQTQWQRGRWEKNILSTRILFPPWKSGITDNKEITTPSSHGVAQFRALFAAALVTHCQVLECHQCHSGHLYSCMAAYVTHDNKLQFFMLYQQNFAFQSLLLFHLANDAPFLCLRKGTFPPATRGASF